MKGWRWSCWRPRSPCGPATSEHSQQHWSSWPHGKGRPASGCGLRCFLTASAHRRAAPPGFFWLQVRPDGSSLHRGDKREHAGERPASGPQSGHCHQGDHAHLWNQEVSPQIRLCCGQQLSGFSSSVPPPLGLSEVADLHNTSSVFLLINHSVCLCCVVIRLN